MVTIDFRGVMLFQCSAPGGTLEHVLIPDADGYGQGDWGTNNKHPDGSEATVHHAGLLLQKGGSLEVIHLPLKGTSVTIMMDSITVAPTVELGGLPQFSGLESNPPVLANAACAISIMGGRLDKDGPLPATITSTFKNSTLTHRAIRLVGNSHAKISVVHRSGTWTADMSHGDRAAIYNYEVRYPSFADLDHIGDCESGSDYDDHDFKWLYSLLHNGKGLKLDAPKLKCGNKRTVSVFTCFPGVWYNSGT